MLLQRQFTRLGFLVLLCMGSLTSLSIAGGPAFGPKHRKSSPYDDKLNLATENMCPECSEQFYHLSKPEQRKYASFFSKYNVSGMIIDHACASCRAFQAHMKALSEVETMLCASCFANLKSLSYLEQSQYVKKLTPSYISSRFIEDPDRYCLQCEYQELQPDQLDF